MKSYNFGLLQTAAFKGLKGYTATLLQPHDINTYQWALIGVLFDAPAGLGTTQLAVKLQVSKPFITKSVGILISKGWIKKSNAPDLRSVRFVLTPTAIKKVPVIEKHLKKEMKAVLGGIPKLQLLAYILVLQHIEKKLKHSIDTTAPEPVIQK